MIACKLKDLIDIYDFQRIPLSTMERSQIPGIYPYYSANGIIDHINKFIFKGRYILLAEDGSVKTNENHPVIKLTKDNEQFWVSNHAHVFKAKKGINTQYLFYNLSCANINECITGAVQLKVSQENLLNLSIKLHSTEEQQHIVDTTSSPQ